MHCEFLECWYWFGDWCDTLIVLLWNRIVCDCYLFIILWTILFALVLKHKEEIYCINANVIVGECDWCPGHCRRVLLMSRSLPTSAIDIEVFARKCYWCWDLCQRVLLMLSSLSMHVIDVEVFVGKCYCCGGLYQRIL